MTAIRVIGSAKSAAPSMMRSASARIFSIMRICYSIVFGLLSKMNSKYIDRGSLTPLEYPVTSHKPNRPVNGHSGTRTATPDSATTSATGSKPPAVP